MISNEEDLRYAEKQINEELAKAGRFADMEATVQKYAPGWEYVDATYLGGPPMIALTRHGRSR